MTTTALPNSILRDRWNHFASRVRFKFVLPHRRMAQIAGVKLDIRKLSPVMKNIILTGRYEAQERRLAAQALTSLDVVLELGGAIGFIGLYCLKVLGVKHVTSVEANPDTLKMLRKNYALNGLQPQVIHAAAAGEDGELELDVGGEFWENSLTRNSANRLRVPALSLRSLVARMPMSPTVLICDIEGAEQYLDFTQLPASVTRIIMELHPEMIGQERVDELLQRLEVQGFKVVCSEAGTCLFKRDA